MSGQGVGERARNFDKIDGFAPHAQSWGVCRPPCWCRVFPCIAPGAAFAMVAQLMHVVSKLMHGRGAAAQPESGVRLALLGAQAAQTAPISRCRYAGSAGAISGSSLAKQSGRMRSRSHSALCLMLFGVRSLFLVPQSLVVPQRLRLLAVVSILLVLVCVLLGSSSASQVCRWGVAAGGQASGRSLAWHSEAPLHRVASRWPAKKMLCLHQRP